MLAIIKVAESLPIVITSLSQSNIAFASVSKKKRLFQSIQPASQQPRLPAAKWDPTSESVGDHQVFLQGGQDRLPESEVVQSSQ